MNYACAQGGVRWASAFPWAYRSKPGAIPTRLDAASRIRNSRRPMADRPDTIQWHDDPAHPPGFDDASERAMAWKMVVLVLLALTVAKTIGSVPFIGTVALTVAVVMQLYIPLWRAQKLGRDYDFVGLHTRALGRDLKIVAILIAIAFPPYAYAHHLYVTEAHAWLGQLGFDELARWIPSRRFAPRWPAPDALLPGSLWFLEMSATHLIGVALPEETFYRGYLQPRLESKSPPTRRFFGVPIGRAAVLCTFLFALGHVLGEWNPLRMGPFLPGLVFAWQRNASSSVLGAILFHGLCNIFGEVLFSLYVPM
ncbi:MAG: CPBP family intramembrane glutamic endopeptidase [Myxococcota bacterium]